MTFFKHRSVLPYISIASPFSRPLRFLIEIEASAPFLNPEFVHPNDLEDVNPITITTIFDQHSLNKRITLLSFLEFNQPGECSFLIFKFHKYFDGLLGFDILSKLGAKVDLENKTLITKNATIPLLYKPNFTSAKYTVPRNLKTLAKLPVDIRSGEVYLPKTEMTRNLTVSEGIYLR